jgi:hypothetical protein
VFSSVLLNFFSASEILLFIFTLVVKIKKKLYSKSIEVIFRRFRCCGSVLPNKTWHNLEAFLIVIKLQQ